MSLLDPRFRLDLLKEALSPQEQQATPVQEPTGYGTEQQQAVDPMQQVDPLQQIEPYTPIPVPQQGFPQPPEPARDLLGDLDLQGVGEPSLPATTTTDTVGSEYSTPGPSGISGGGKFKRAQMGEMLSDPLQSAGGGPPLTNRGSRRKIRELMAGKTAMFIPQDVMAEIEAKVETKLAARQGQREGSSMTARDRLTAKKISMLLKRAQNPRGTAPPPTPQPAQPAPPPPSGGALGPMMTTSGQAGARAYGRPMPGHGSSKVSQLWKRAQNPPPTPTPPPVPTAPIKSTGTSALGPMMTTSGQAGARAQGRPMPPGHGSTKVSADFLAQVQEQAFQEQKAKYAQAGPLNGPMEGLQDVRERQVGWMPALGGIAGGAYGGKEIQRRMQEQFQDQARKYLRKGKGRMPLPWYMTRTKVRDAGKNLWSKVVSKMTGGAEKSVRGTHMRFGPRVALRAGLPLAGLWAAKGLFGRRKSEAERMYGHGTSKVAGGVGDWMAEHPGTTAMAGGAAGALLPWALGKVPGVPKEYMPQMSGTGAAVGGIAGYLAAKRSQRKNRQAAMLRERKRREHAMMLAMQQQGMQQGGPFG